MHFTVISSQRAPHQLAHQNAVIEGLQALGVRAYAAYSYEGAQTKFIACWGWRLGSAMRARGHEVLVLERGYIGDRFKMTSLAWNGLNGHAKFAPGIDDGGARFREHAQLKPWKDGGDYALILGQVPRDASLRGRNLVPWYVQTAAQIKKIHGLKVKFRQHPDVTKKKYRQFVAGAELSTGALEDELAGAAFTVCYNSNSSVDSILAGVPCVVDDRGSMAYEVCGHTLHDVVRPYREPWAHALAWKQWDLEEIRSGAALRGLLEIHGT